MTCSDNLADGSVLGEIKWFGGLNGKTGRENDYGFLSAAEGDVYFHRSGALSPSESLTAGAKVVFQRYEDKKGKQARSVRVVSQLRDEELVALLRETGSFSAEDTLILAMSRKVLPPCTEEVLRAVSVLTALKGIPRALDRFWELFPPADPKDPFFRLAPTRVKVRICKKFYATFKERLENLFVSVNSASTSLPADAIYRELDERDEEIAKSWAGSESEAVLARMLSARAAEKATKRFYEGVGLHVEDVAIRQLDGQSRDWTTHDLLVDTKVAIDVKNARRPINGKQFYVEHTVPRFKLARLDGHVMIAGILSPYLQLKYIRNPAAARFDVDELIFLGETSRNGVDELITMFGSSSFEVTRGNENTVPHWVFSYPRVWYREFFSDIQRFREECAWPEGEEWDYVLDDSEKMGAIPAFCVAGIPLPDAISALLSSFQQKFYTKMQVLGGNQAVLPVIFLMVLTDFVERLKENTVGFSPSAYLPLLFAESRRGADSYPLGAIDPLRLIHGLVDVLETLWDSRGKEDLARFSGFQFGGLGILRGRENGRPEWTTLVAYCGGTIYATDECGTVLLTADGKPQGVKGKCGHAPLVIGVNGTCPTCRRLVCSECRFCSPRCRERLFLDQAEIQRRTATQPQYREVQIDGGFEAAAARWEEVPLEVYAEDTRRL